jgi:hypothetical protein
MVDQEVRLHLINALNKNFIDVYKQQKDFFKNNKEEFED